MFFSPTAAATTTPGRLKDPVINSDESKAAHGIIDRDTDIGAEHGDKLVDSHWVIEVFMEWH